MDEAVTRLERAMAADPEDDGVRVELARALTRVGRPLRALAVLGPRDAVEHEVATRALAAAMRLERRPGDRLVDPAFGGEMALVPGGAFLDDGEEGLSSSLHVRQGRASLRRVVVPSFLAWVEHRANEDTFAVDEIRRRADLVMSRLPTRLEWKKLWRGGLFLDGDLSARVDNPDPDRLLPQGEPPEPGVPARSPYGAELDLDACEVLAPGDVGGIFDRSSCRYFTSIATPEERRGRRLVWRLVRDLPRELG